MVALVVDAGQQFAGHTRHTTRPGKYTRLTATGAVKASPGVLLGFYVANTTAGTLVLWDNPGAATPPQISGTITPAVGWNEYPAIFVNGLWAVIAGTALDVTFFYL